MLGVVVASPCPFCAIVAGEQAAHIVLETLDALAFLDVSPLFVGHVLVVPRVHHDNLADLAPGLTGPLFAAVQRVAAALPAALGADGSFVAVNNVVSQSVPHVHVHVVPRRRKDGLRGFFWPRQRYADDTEMTTVAAAIREAIAPSR